MNAADTSRNPRHVAIIMDGNGRWAAARGLPRSSGHKAGLEAVRRAVRAAADLGIEYLTIYSFSTENWSRPKTEVSFLMTLLKRFIRQDVAELHAAGVRIKIIGSRDSLEPSLVTMLDDVERLTAGNSNLNLTVAFNYGSRQEIVRAAQKIAASGEPINEVSLASALDTCGMPDVDLMVRTGGEERISNFLLWQSAYAEFVFQDEYWPEFDAAALQRAIDTYRSRERRFGGLKAQSA